MNTVVIGAGKIARGFIGHLLWKGGYPFQFLEYNREVADELNRRKQYTVRLLGEQVQEETVTGFTAWDYDHLEEAMETIALTCSTVFVAVGGKNLKGVAQFLLQALLMKMVKQNTEPLNIVLCENWIHPGQIIRNVLYSTCDEAYMAFLDRYVGVAESVIMRSAIEPLPEVLEQDPLAVNVQDFWYLPIEKRGLKGPLPVLPGLTLIDDFDGYLDRKFYTYNAANGTVSYLGYLKGYRFISDAAHDPEILEILEQVYRETGRALCMKHGFDFEEHMKFTRTSLSKLQNVHIVDYIERNARDPIRKLGPADRLVGPARLVLEYGGMPDALSISIAAAIHYDESSDPIARDLRDLRLVQGVDHILDTVCMLGKGDEVLRTLIHEKVSHLRRKGWLAREVWNKV